MQEPSRDPLSVEAVRHVARLARLRLTDEQLEAYREQLSTILDHLDTLRGLDLDDVEPMAHPLDITNRLAEDQVGPSLPVEDVLRNAPATEQRFLAVPKVLGGDDGSSA